MPGHRGGHIVGRSSSRQSPRKTGGNRGLLKVITIDNGPEFERRALDEWAYQKGVKLNFIGPRKPIENAFAENFTEMLRTSV